MTNKGICVGGPSDGLEISDLRKESRHIVWDRTNGSMSEDGYTVHIYRFEDGRWVHHPELSERVGGDRPAC